MHVTYGTAWFGLHLRGQLQPGETVLVLAAAGGVGSAAVELAKQHGCWVVAAAGGPAKVEACRGLGADEVIDYRERDFTETDETWNRILDMVATRGPSRIARAPTCSRQRHCWPSAGPKRACAP